jgi:dTDP-4-amino-4,6-dideoxygalactose transaminase
VGQLDFLETVNQRRRQNAAELSQRLGGLPGLVPPPEPAGRTPVYSLYTVRVTAGARMSRDELADHLRRLGVETGVYYPRLAFDQPAFVGHPQVSADPAPRAAEMAREVLSLPVHPRLSSAQLGHLSAAVIDALT